MNKPRLKLIGENGNAFMDEATNGDYNNLLRTCMDHFDVS